MSNPTSNFGWQMPTNSDLVTDLPADFEVFGQAVDTSLADLKGGTTGQVLSKATNTDMDFTWVSPTTGDITGVTAGTGISGGGTSGDVTITNSMATAIDAKGDLIVGTAADTFSRLAVGTNNYVLTADSAEATGMKWAANPSGGGFTLLSTTSLSSATTTISSISQSYKHLVLIFNDCYNSAGDSIYVRPNSATSGYYYAGIRVSSGAANYYNVDNGTRLPVMYAPENTTGRLGQGEVWFYNYTTSANKSYFIRGFSGNGGTNKDAITMQGYYGSSSAISSMEISGNGSTVTGTLYIYGVS